MKKIFFLAALGLSVMAQATELNYYKTLVDEQADATKGQTQLYNLDFYADGSLLLLSSYQTASASETGLVFDAEAYQGGTASKWGANAGDMKYTNMRNAFFAKLDAEGNVLWARADTTGDYDLANTVITATPNGGAFFADKFRTRKGVYMSYFTLYDKDGNMVATNNMAFTNYDSIVVDSKKVKRKEAFSWAGAALDEDGYVYIAGLQADTLLPVWNDSIAPRKAWNTKGNMSQNCNTVILKYKPQYNQFQDLDYVGAVINSDELVYDRPLGLHYENGKLYVAGTYSNGTESGIYAARYDKNLTREYITYNPINGSLQFQQTMFEDGKIYVCGGLSKGSITIGEKTLETAGNFNNGLVYVMSMTDGKAVDAAINHATNNALNITVGAFKTDTGVVAYNHETLNGIQLALIYNKNMELVQVDSLGAGGGSSTVSCVARTADGKKTAGGLRARTTGEYTFMGQTLPDYSDKTNWYSVLAVFGEKEGPHTNIEATQVESQKAVKFIQNGQLFIRRGDKIYNVLGF